MTTSFTTWTHWTNRAELSGLSYPGVYVLAIASRDISGTHFSWVPEIVYVGMTNAKGGLKARLGQFDNTIKGGEGHGGGERVRLKHSDYAALVPVLYVAVCSFPCDVTSEKAHDLRIMGEVAKHEYECFACFVEKFGKLPEFNDKRRAPKDKKRLPKR